MDQIKDLIVEGTKTIRKALQVIDKNKRGICLVTESGKLLGIASDGDIRRGLLKDSNLERPIMEIMNKDFIALPIGSSDELIRKTFSSYLKLIPLLDQSGKIVDVADVRRSHKIPVLEPMLSGGESDYVQDCISSNWISSKGSYVHRFSDMFQDMHPNTSALTVANGTTALHLALVTLGIQEGDEVIVPDVTFAATINAVLYCQATPVICEIDKDTWCIDVKEIRELITPRTRALIPVHLYGQPCQMDDLMSLANDHNLIVVEDCAEAIGSEWHGKPVGTFGDAATFSFFGNKMISTGEGGMVLFRNRENANKARLLRDHGMNPDKRYWHDIVGFNYRMTNLQAAIGVAQMERFSAILKKKLDIAKAYETSLMGIEEINQLPKNISGVIHSNWLYTIILDSSISRDNVMQELLKHGVDTRPVFHPLHQMPPYQNFRSSDRLKNSKYISSQGLSLPSATTLKEEEITYVVKMIHKIIKEYDVKA